MALRPLERVRDTQRLVIPSDPAIDQEASGEALDRYRLDPTGEGTRDLVFVEDELDEDGEPREVEPTWFHVRGLSPRERPVVMSMCPPAPASDVDPQWTYMVSLQWCRVGIVRVDNLEGWSRRARARDQGLVCWHEEQLELLDPSVVIWLANAIGKLTQGSDRAKKNSG